MTAKRATAVRSVIGTQNDGLDVEPGLDTFAAKALDATACLVVVLDTATGVVRAVNQAILNTTGFDRDEVVGHPIAPNLMSQEDFARAQQLHLRPTSACSRAPFEAPLLTKAAGQCRVLWSAEQLPRPEGATAYVVISGLNLSADSKRGGLVSHLLLADVGTCSVATDLEGRVTYWSDGAERLLGYSRHDMTGHPLPATLFDHAQLRERAEAVGAPSDLTVLRVDASKFERRSSRRLDLGPLDRRTRAATDTRSGTGGVSVGTWWTLIHHDGTRLTLEVTVATIREPNGNPVGFLGVGSDVTAQHRTHDLLTAAMERESRAAQRLRELDEAKDRLLATVSHELRTPLASIDGYTELLEDGLSGELNARQSAHVAAIRRNADRLSRLVEDLLTLSGIEAGASSCSHTDLDLRGPVLKAWEQSERSGAARLLNMSLNLAPEPVLVRGDAAGYARAVSNLLSNSVKCTEDGGSVTCVLLAQHGRASLQVTDTGFGIPADEQGSLFTRFFRTTTAQEREVPGSGLGLVIAAAIIDNCGGSISVDSEHLDGAVFTIDLPLSNPDARGSRTAS
jgi:signal transduction histidine kinase